jgi:hypothetical protein
VEEVERRDVTGVAPKDGRPAREFFLLILLLNGERRQGEAERDYD